MFSNAVLIDGAEKTLDDIFLYIAKCIKECASNDEAYVTFKFVNVPEQTIKNLDLALKKLHYGTFLCYHLYDDDDTDEKKISSESNNINSNKESSSEVKRPKERKKRKRRIKRKPKNKINSKKAVNSAFSYAKNRRLLLTGGFA